MAKNNHLRPKERKELVERVIKDGVSISQACRSFNVSRPTFYKLLKQYKKAKALNEEPDFSNSKINKPHWRRLSYAKEKKILDFVKKHPEYSVHTIAQILKNIGHHGIQNVLKRYHLNTYPQRLDFSSHQQEEPSLFNPAICYLLRVDMFCYVKH